MSDLKPCPFCGGKASKESREYGNGSTYAWVFCLKCGCSTPKIPISLDYSARDKANDLWNKRARMEMIKGEEDDERGEDDG